MKCPRCSSSKSHIYDVTPYADRVWRRRQCLACGHRFTTIETIMKDRLVFAESQTQKER
jgi:transcriptional repressor NrdR